jgi:hypothetical protein
MLLLNSFENMPKNPFCKRNVSMNPIDMRFNVNVIKGLIGKTFIKYKCDAFDFTNSVTQIIGIYIGERVFSLTNIQENVDYFGDDDDVAICRFTETVDDSVKSAFKDTEMITTPVGGTIDKILIINENQKLFKNDEELYNVWLTRAIIFYVDRREISFEKDNVPFSEEIVIHRGYDLIEKLSDEKEFLTAWSEGLVPECTRDIIEIA